MRCKIIKMLCSCTGTHKLFKYYYYTCWLLSYQDYYDSQLCPKRYINDYETDTADDWYDAKYTNRIKMGFYLKSVIAGFFLMIFSDRTNLTKTLSEWFPLLLPPTICTPKVLYIALWKRIERRRTAAGENTGGGCLPGVDQPPLAHSRVIGLCQWHRFSMHAHTCDEWRFYFSVPHSIILSWRFWVHWAVHTSSSSNYSQTIIIIIIIIKHRYSLVCTRGGRTYKIMCTRRKSGHAQPIIIII